MCRLVIIEKNVFYSIQLFKGNNSDHPLVVATRITINKECLWQGRRAGEQIVSFESCRS